MQNTRQKKRGQNRTGGYSGKTNNKTIKATTTTKQQPKHNISPTNNNKSEQNRGGGASNLDKAYIPAQAQLGTIGHLAAR
jgi:hypothetical protein